MRIKKIVTHAGTFHADEICAIALINTIFESPTIERTFTPSEEDLQNPEVFVLDIGRRYEPKLNNYDHHQDAELPATNKLIFERFFPGMVGDNSISRFIQYISDVDTGVIVENKNTPPTISGLVRACNNLPSPEGQDVNFFNAVVIMQLALKAQFELFKLSKKSKELWEKTERYLGFAIHDSAEFIANWQELAEEEDVMFLITPNTRGGYQIMSRDSKQFPIPTHERQTFLHNAKFIASYPTIADAISHAVEIVCQCQ